MSCFRGPGRGRLQVLSSARWLATALAIPIFLIHSLANAQLTPSPSNPSNQPDYSKAKKHYDAAETASSQGRWSDAAREYEAAFEITQDSVLFYKLGYAHEMAGDCKTAVTFYRRYLAEAKPSESFAKQTAAKIAACEAKLAGAPETAPTETTAAPTETTAAPTETTAAPTETETTPNTTEQTAPPVGTQEAPPMLASTNPLQDPAEDGQPSWQRTAAWISVGVAVSFVVTGTVLGLAAQSRADDIQSDIDFRDINNLPARFQGTAASRYNDLINQGNNLEVAAYVSFGAAVTAIAAATTFFILDPGNQPSHDSALTVAPVIGPKAVAVTAMWSF